MALSRRRINPGAGAGPTPSQRGFHPVPILQEGASNGIIHPRLSAVVISVISISTTELPRRATTAENDAETCTQKTNQKSETHSGC